jgi:hypothetical protein
MLGYKDIVRVVVQGHGTCCWGAMIRHMLLGCKDMAHVGVQGHGTCCWVARTWFMLLGCKVVSYIQGKCAHHSGDNFKETAGVLHHDQRIDDY